MLLFRVLTFLINAFVLRYVSKDLLGVVNVRLTLLYSTTLFIGREAFRKACLSKEKDDVPWRSIINIAWYCPILGLISVCLLSYIWLYMLELPNPDRVPHYGLGVFCFALAPVIEMTVEPLFIIGQRLLYVRFKALIEGLALLVKCMLTIILIVTYPDSGIHVFSVAQLAFTTVYVGGYYLYFTRQALHHQQTHFPLSSPTEFLPQFSGVVFIDRKLATLTWSFLKQSFLKQLLTEGERYMMTMFNILSFADQGVFDVISNLGSLVARFLFLPLEESSYLLFSQSITRGLPADKQPQESWKLATTVLCHLLKAVSVVGLTILVFGISYSQLALHLYGGALLSSGVGPYLLKWYCVYVLVLAINGITECFSFATMSKEAVDSYNYKMLGFSAAFLLAALVFTQMFGSAGFIMANACNMAARIAHSLYVISLFYKNSKDFHPLRDSCMSPALLLGYGVVFVILCTSEHYFGMSSAVLHLGVGLGCLASILLLIYVKEKPMVTFIIDKFLFPMAQKKTI